MLVSVVISTYNRASALSATLDALGTQDIPPHDYEVLVIDDGSSDSTAAVLEALSVPYDLRVFRLSSNQGVSAGRNVGLRNASGRFIIMISDDLIVPRDFIRTHVETLERFPKCWVVGGFTQLDSLTATPFGRYLDRLEQEFQRLRLDVQLDDGIFKMRMPTARNLSLRQSDLEEVGLFDEQFRVTCEDQDLACRASEHGISYVYTAALDCVHNDQAADLRRYCRFQEMGARDTVRLCEKHLELHGNSRIARSNGYVTRYDTCGVAFRKVGKRVLATTSALAGIRAVTKLAEAVPLPDRALNRVYRILIGLYTFKGFRDGLREAGGRDSSLAKYLERTPPVR